MDPITIISLTLGLVARFGPDALSIFQKWQGGLPDGKPTTADWERLEQLAKPPDAYDPE